MLDLTQHPIVFQQPHKIDLSVPSWLEHIPFAFFITDLLRPAILVELGVHSGNSYNAFCQAVKALNLNTRCFGVDTWEGDTQAGYYDESIYLHLLQYQKEHYGLFSDLLKTKFETAVSSFQDKSIDLLHIDGWHTYEAVKRDFEAWLPKMSDSGVVLMHDTSVRKGDFGVWKFWKEVSSRYPSFNFSFGSGLGVLLVGVKVPKRLKEFIERINKTPELESFFYNLGKLIPARRIAAEYNALTVSSSAQLFFDTGQGWIEAESIVKTVFLGKNRIHFDLVGTGAKKKLRFDPAFDACIVSLDHLLVDAITDGRTQFQVSNHNAQFNFKSIFIFLEQDPQIEIEILTDTDELREIDLELSYYTFDKLGVQAFRKVLDYFDHSVTLIRKQQEEERAKRLAISQEIAGYQQEVENLKEENEYLSLESENVKQDSQKVIQENEGLRQDNQKVIQENEGLRQDNQKVIQENEGLRQHNQKVIQENEGLRQHNQKVIQENEGLRQHNQKVVQENEGLRQHNQKVVQENEGLRQHNQKVVQENEELKQENQRSRQENQNLEQKQMAALTQHLVRLEALNEQIRDLQQQLHLKDQAMQEANQEARQAELDYREQLSEREKSLASFIKEIKQQRVNFQDLVEEKDQYIARAASAKKEMVIAYEHEINTSKVLLENLDQAFKQLQFDHQELISASSIEAKENKNLIASFQHDLATQKQRALDLEQDGLHKSIAISDLRSSLSFRLGWLLTWPFRMVYEFFNKIKSGRRMNVILKLLMLAAKSPIAFLRQFSFQKISILFKALREEPPQQILGNFQNLLSNQPQGLPHPQHSALSPLPLPAAADYTSDPGPLISVVVPVYNTPIAMLRECINSVIDQSYPTWELLLVDDCSPKANIRPFLEKAEADHDQIRVLFLPENRNIADATNAGIADATGDFIALLDHDDRLTTNALLEVATYLERHPATDVLYSDQDKIDEKGTSYEPFYKPDWSHRFFWGVMYVGHLLVFRKNLWEKAGKIDHAFNGIQDYEFMLRLSEHTDQIRHIPKILYHWRAIEGSIAASHDSKGDLADLQIKAVNQHLDRLGIPGYAQATAIPHRLSIVPKERTVFPLVSIIIPTKDSPKLIGQCLTSIFEQTAYPNFEVLLVDNNTTDPDALAIYEKYPVKIIPFHETFNFSRANNLGVQNAAGEYLIFLNNDVELLTPTWIEEFLFYVEQSDIGAVGPLLTFPNDSVQHAGVVLGFRGTADHVMRNFPAQVDGYFGSLSCAREVSAVTAACLMMSKKLFEAVDGFNEVYAQIYQDVDLCLKIRALGLNLIYTPNVKLIHYESATRDASKYDFLDRVLLLDQWQEVIEAGDPFYNPNFKIQVYNETLSGYQIKAPAKHIPA